MCDKVAVFACIGLSERTNRRIGKVLSSIMISKSSISANFVLFQIACISHLMLIRRKEFLSEDGYFPKKCCPNNSVNSEENQRTDYFHFVRFHPLLMTNSDYASEPLESVKYWETVPATINGVLGGFSYAHIADIEESKALLAAHIGSSVHPSTDARVLDCGAGIGRIGQFLLQGIFATIDMVEPCAHLMSEAKKRIKAEKLGSCFMQPLQEVSLSAETYDCITVQWVCMYLSDEELCAFLRRCAKALKSDGFIFLKENLSNCEGTMEDTSDASKTRTEEEMDAIISKAGLRMRRKQKQKKWYNSLLPVCMYILTV